MSIYPKPVQKVKFVVQKVKFVVQKVKFVVQKLKLVVQTSVIEIILQNSEIREKCLA